ncbi:HD domain-containing protein [Coxiella burnetii]|uniref:HD domain-containing protein n=1 Tax=Coxiella burnetii TaxID=777 RepID=UPI00050969C2|nr:inositol oxygenase family protein [Coxiella burnetii]
MRQRKILNLHPVQFPLLIILNVKIYFNLEIKIMNDKATFSSIDVATNQDMEAILKATYKHEEQLPKILIELLSDEREDAFPVSRYEHALQTATRAYQDGCDDEFIVVALLHDIGELFSPFNHSHVSAAILKPYISEENHCILKNHDVFQGYYFWDKLGLDKNAREKFRGHPLFERTALFCEKYDCPAFDVNFKPMPISAFEPMVKKIFSQ